MTRWNFFQNIRTTPGFARSPAHRARSVARLGAAVGPARRSARSGQYPGRHQGGARLARRFGRKSRWRAKPWRPGGDHAGHRIGVAFMRPAGISAGGRAAYFTRDGGFIRSGAHAPLDEVRALRDESRRVIASLENKYRGASGIAALKIKHNGVLGYFIEVTQQHADRLMAEQGICSATARPWRGRCAFPPTNWQPGQPHRRSRRTGAGAGKPCSTR